jgi:hypothetical protein
MMKFILEVEELGWMERGWSEDLRTSEPEPMWLVS